MTVHISSAHCNLRDEKATRISEGEHHCLQGELTALHMLVCTSVILFVFIHPVKVFIFQRPVRLESSSC